MAMYPEVGKRMREEVLDTHGLDKMPTYESIRNLKYSMSCCVLALKALDLTVHVKLTVRAVLNETLRLFPPVPLNVRETRGEPVVLPVSKNPSESSYIATPQEPLYVPKSTIIIHMPMLMQRNPDLWGPDADEFIPERYLLSELGTKPGVDATGYRNDLMFGHGRVSLTKLIYHCYSQRNQIIAYLSWPCSRPELCRKSLTQSR